ncbi:reverse transcriptase-like protein, partial [Acinetobacter baumannii]
TNQLSGDYQARDERMAAYLAHTKQLLLQFEKVEVKQIGRESNSHADALASLASAVEAGRKRTIEVEALEKPSIKLQPPRLVLC